ncbi:WxL domain-containing protein [Candidatus Enterococcus willemsii]|uniref:WxL domain-containing protein n=1 Tax=Candidatus Enterococcus willemsii TaxID=1857215 RepID=A0ABQ6YW77_9ENTE|nr:WxL domain-containing protein [Enterococcus sp. CU12B]KAF1301958.1 hypothetical protein BAU17_00900 [Enterococcus sp. CU12B]
MKKLLFGSLLIVGTLIYTPAALANETNGEVRFTTGGLTLDPYENGSDVTKKLPRDLNFGSHAIQLEKKGEDKWYATSAAGNGVYGDGSTLTKGAIVVRDNRGRTDSSWSLSVQQEEQFTIQSSGKTLGTAELNMKVSDLENNVSSLPRMEGFVDETFKNQSLKTFRFANYSAATILTADTGTGIGETTLPLEVFELVIPEDVVEYEGIYTTTLVWTLNAGTTP